MFYLYARGMSMREVAVSTGVPYAYPLLNDRTYRKVTMSGGEEKRLNNVLSVGVNIGISRYTLFNAETVLNADIRAAVSKQRTAQRFQKRGIPHPKTYESLSDAFDHHRFVLARQDRLHSGRGITLLDKHVHMHARATEVAGVDYYSEWLRFRAEARVHVFGDDIIAVQVKHVPDTCTSFIHTHETGCTYEVRRGLSGWLGERGARQAYELAWNAVNALGLYFGAVDIFQDTDKNMYVLEVNTAPGVQIESLHNAYVQAFRSFLV